MAAWLILATFLFSVKLGQGRWKGIYLLRRVRRSFLSVFLLFLAASIPAIFSQLAWLLLYADSSIKFDFIEVFRKTNGILSSILWILAVPLALAAVRLQWTPADFLRLGPSFLRRRWKPLAGCFVFFWVPFLLLFLGAWLARGGYDPYTGVDERGDPWPGILAGMALDILLPVLSVGPFCVLYRIVDRERRGERFSGGLHAR
jgi:hypothetical protein